MRGVASTALLTAAARAIETERPGALFSDPFSRALAGDRGFEIFDTTMRPLGGWPPDIPIPSRFALRTRYYDDELLSSAAEMTQVVLLAAGMDTRAFRLDWPKDTTVFEIDQAPVFAHKERVLAELGATPRCTRCIISADLRDDWRRALIDSGFRPEEPATFLAEGLLFYLDEGAARTLLRDTATLAEATVVIHTDIAPTSVRDLGFLKPWRETYEQLGAPFLFFHDDGVTLLEECGWQRTASSLQEAAARFGANDVIPSTDRILLVGRRD